MGNSLLDIIVFGRVTGIMAAKKAKGSKHGKLTLEHIIQYNKELAKIKGELHMKSPILLPDYRRDETKKKTLDVF